jgi:NADPH-dependent 2,4-dienoyl-CoA reductase/sulfur reductase-like enzyme
MGDAAGVVAVQGDALDGQYLRHWAGELKVGNILEDLMAGRIRPKQT